MVIFSLLLQLLFLPFTNLIFKVLMSKLIFSCGKEEQKSKHALVSFSRFNPLAHSALPCPPEGVPPASVAHTLTQFPVSSSSPLPVVVDYMSIGYNVTVLSHRCSSKRVLLR